MLITLGYSHEFSMLGLKRKIQWDTDFIPFIMVNGLTGGGKSTLSLYILNQLLTAHKDIYICTYKPDDWDNILPDERYGEFSDCDRILDIFLSDFELSLEQKTKTEKYLLFDEFSSYALSKDSKEFKELMHRFSRLVFMGRAFGYHVILISQIFSSKVIDTELRAQCGIKIFLGSTISTEIATMLFPNIPIDKSVRLPKYTGYITTPTKDIDIIQVPYIDMHRLKKLLIEKGKYYRKISEGGEATVGNLASYPR